MHSIVVALILALTPTTSAQSGVAGAWDLSFNTASGARSGSATFKVDGEKLTGSLLSEAGEIPLEGTVKENSFKVTFSVPTSSGTLSISMSGEVDGDSIKGTFDYGQGGGDFTGKRKAQGL